MSAALHILQSEDHVAAFDLQPGSHLLGIGEDADLMLSDAHAKNDLCDVEVTPEPQITLLSFSNIPLRSPNREASAEMIVAEGRFVEVSGLTITLLRTSDLGDVQVDPPRSVPVTAKSIAHEHVSAWHAEVVQKADGLWLNDLTSSNGTFLNGTIFGSGAIPKGAAVGEARLLELVVERVRPAPRALRPVCTFGQRRRRKPRRLTESLTPLAVTHLDAYSLGPSLQEPAHARTDCRSPVPADHARDHDRLLGRASPAS